MKKTAFDELIAAIRSDDTARQEEAANKICALHDPASLQFILAALKKNDPLTRRVMLWALRNYSAELEYAQYLSYLADEDLGVREAARMLFMEGGQPAGDTLVAAISSNDMTTQYASVQALGQFRKRCEAKGLRVEDSGVIDWSSGKRDRAINELVRRFASHMSIRGAQA